MIIYHYEPVTFVYLGHTSEADEDPLDPGHFLIPANATELVPPNPGGPKKQPVFREGAWVLELVPLTPALTKNTKGAPAGMWPRVGIKEALKGGVT